MVFYGILCFIVLGALGIVGFLFYLLNKEGAKKEEHAVPVTDISEFKKEEPISSIEEFTPPPLSAEQPSDQPKFETTPMSTLYPKEESSLPLEPAPSSKEEEYQRRILELEEELQQISNKAVGQAQEALTMIDQLNKENSLLKLEKETRDAEHEAKIKVIGEQTFQLKQDNEALQVQLDSSRTKVNFLEEEVLAVKKQMGEELAKANAVIEELRLTQAQTPQPVESSIDPQIETLKNENQTLMQANVDFQKSVQKLKELNDHLIEKSDILQYELTKARAQSTGLERACENYKNQLEALFKANPSARFNRLPAGATTPTHG